MCRFVSLCVCLCVLVASTASADELWTSYYGGDDGYCGSMTASGEVYDCEGYTAATNLYDMGTVLEVCWDSCVDVTVTDRCGGCGIDLSMAAARDSGIFYDGPGVAQVTVLN